MSHSTFYAPMTRVYDKRVLGMAALWMWVGVVVHRGPAQKNHLVVLSPDWPNSDTRHLWFLSVDARTVYRTSDVEDAIAAKNELLGMIGAARLLAGKS